MFSNANLDHLQNSIEALELRGQRRKILILLAAYNGEKYLSEQIKSIQGQTISNWTLVVRDDGSDDNSKDIIEDFAVRDTRIRLLHDEREGRGMTYNFAALMQVALAEGADAVFFSDQDDIWLPHKIARQLQSLREWRDSMRPVRLCCATQIWK